MAALSVIDKNWKLRMSYWEWLRKLCNINVMEYYCAVRNDETEVHMKLGKAL